MKILVLGDIHAPFCDWAALEACAEFNKYYKSDHIVQVGDLLDRYNWSRFIRHPDSPSAQDEHDRSLVALDRIHKLFGPKTPFTVLMGNHDRRLLAKAWEANIPAQLVRGMSELVTHKNWKWHPDLEPLMLDGFAFVHGDESPGGRALNKAQRLGVSVVQGHLHVDAGVNWLWTFNHRIAAVDVGCLADRFSIAARYARKNLIHAFVGWATITDGIPALHPFFGKAERKKRSRKG